MVMVPLLVQFDTVVDAVTEIVFPAQGSTGPGVGEGLLFEQEIKLAEPKAIMIAKQSNDIFFDIQLVLYCIEIKKLKVAPLKNRFVVLGNGQHKIIGCRT